MTGRLYRQCGLFARFGVDARSCSIIESRPIPLRVDWRRVHEARDAETPMQPG